MFTSFFVVLLAEKQMKSAKSEVVQFNKYIQFPKITEKLNASSSSLFIIHPQQQMSS